MYSESWKDRLVRWIVNKLPRTAIYFAVIRARDSEEWAAEDAVAILAAEVVRRWEESVRSRMDKEGGVFRSSFSEILDQLVIRQVQIRLRLCLGLLLLISAWSGIVVYLCWIAFGS